MKDKKVEKILNSEIKRQKSVINLVASENYVSKDVLNILGSEFTNKYAEGYPGKRYYGGNEFIDEIENLCKERALKLFKLSKNKWSVNVQPLSGSPANLAIIYALVPKGEKIMGMNLTDGGHLTHGYKVSATGNIWKSVSFGVDPKTGLIDYAEVKKIAQKEKPKLIIAGFTAYPRKVDFKKFGEIAKEVGAYLLADISHISGLVSAGLHPSPFTYADVVMTTTHKILRGPRSALIYSKNEISQGIDKAVFPALQGGPHMNQIAGVAVALEEASKATYKKYASQVIKNAKAFSLEMKKLGWKIVSGGTDTHLILVDTFGTIGMGGREASESLEKAGIIVNKNTIPGEQRTPQDPSGVRIGTPAETTRGKKERDFIKIAQKIDKVLRG